MRKFVRYSVALLALYLVTWTLSYLFVFLSRGEGLDFAHFFEYLSLAWTFRAGELPAFIWLLSVAIFLLLAPLVIILLRRRSQRRAAAVAIADSRSTMRAILWIFAGAAIAFGIHLASFALIPPTRGPTVRVSHAVLGIAGKILGENYVTDDNPEGEYPRGSLHANWPGQRILIVFWSLVYLFVFSLVYSVFAWIKRSRAA